MSEIDQHETDLMRPSRSSSRRRITGVQPWAAGGANARLKPLHRAMGRRRSWKGLASRRGVMAETGEVGSALPRERPTTT